jgi:hypothetical protein
MKRPRITAENLRRFEKMDRLMWYIFKLCLPLGIGILVLGTMVAGLRDPQHPRNQVPARVSAAGEIVMAMACFALALSFLLEGYVFARGFAKSVRFGVNGIFANTFGAVLLGSGAIALCMFAVRDWLRS